MYVEFHIGYLKLIFGPTLTLPIVGSHLTLQITFYGKNAHQ